MHPMQTLVAAMSATGHAVLATNVLDTTVDRDERTTIWAAAAAEATLKRLADLQATIDFAAERNKHSDAEKAWIRAVDTPLAHRVLAQLQNPGHGVFSQRALVQCINEIVEFGSSDETAGPVTNDDLLRCILGINQEHDQPDRHPDLGRIDEIGPDAFKNVNEYFERIGQEAVDAERIETTVDEVATMSFERCDSLPALLAHTHDTWRRGWPTTPPELVTEPNPAAVFTAAFGVDFDDVLALGLLLLDRARNGRVAHHPDDLVALGADRAAVEFIVREAAADLPSLRRHLTRAQARQQVTHWLRYTLQRFPFARLEDGQLLLLKPQFVKMRIFGGLLFWDVFTKLGGHRTPPARGALHFEQAVADVFEVRVGDELKRMAAATPGNTRPAVADARALRAALRDGPETPSTCDWAISDGATCVLIDANNRPLHQPFAERTGTAEEFKRDLGLNLIGDVPNAGHTKFMQLAATINGLRDNGGVPGCFTVGDRTQFVPLVAVPDVGLPYTALVDYEVVRRARNVPGLRTQNVLPPALVTISELHLLTGIAQRFGRSPIEILARWRRNVASSPFPITLQQHIVWGERIADSPIDDRYLKLGDRVRTQLSGSLTRVQI
ncbi:hypothetical protein [Nocardia sp. NPDC059239]|uniref:hypothetical protein n=1 Tax=unclassified Nocardia TaxID=2637762 RepID=UPI00368F09CE